MKAVGHVNPKVTPHAQRQHDVTKSVKVLLFWIMCFYFFFIMNHKYNNWPEGDVTVAATSKGRVIT